MFVTGATGFIGSHFVNAARADGHEVVGMRRPGSTPRVPVDLGVDWIEGDLPEIRSSDLAGVDAVVHLAAAGVNPAAARWNACFQTNVIDSLALWRAAATAGVRRLIVCGSCFV
jgi:nucleoside-diphosphate-sugar epimerase